jgi:hypothetical protein
VGNLWVLVSLIFPSTSPKGEVSWIISIL